MSFSRTAPATGSSPWPRSPAIRSGHRGGLRWLGCAGFGGGGRGWRFGAADHEAKRTAKRSNWSRRFPALVWSLRSVAPDGTFRARAARLRAIKDEGQVTRSLMLARGDRGAEIALLLGLGVESAEAI